MKILTLIIKQVYFNEIIAGTKNIEYRELRPKSSKRYIIDDGISDVEIIKYDAIRFYVGYNKNRATALVEIKGAYIEILEDENGNDIIVQDDGIEYVMAEICYQLGKVLE